MTSKHAAILRHGLVVRIAIFLLSFLGTLIIVDILIRPILANRIYVRPTPMFRNPWPMNEDLLRYDCNVNFSAEIVGDLAVFLEDPKYRFKRIVQFKTDEIGFRNLPRTRLKDHHVIVLGDSFGAGSGGSQENMFSSVLEQHFGVNNYNLSVGGAGPWRELMTLKYEISNISIDNDGIVLWLLFPANDLDDYYGDYFDIRENGVLRRLLVRADTFQKRSPIKKMLGRKIDRRKLVEINNLEQKELLFYSPYVERMNRSAEDIRSHRNFPEFLRVFDEITELCLVNQLKLFVVLVPSKAETYSWAIPKMNRQAGYERALGFSEVVKSMCDSSRISFLDLGPTFAKLSYEKWHQSGLLLYWPDDTHWNDLGQFFAAGYVSEMVRTAD